MERIIIGDAQILDVQSVHRGEDREAFVSMLVTHPLDPYWNQTLSVHLPDHDSLKRGTVLRLVLEPVEDVSV